MNLRGEIRTHLLKKILLLITLILFGAGTGCSSVGQNIGGLPDNDPELAVRLVKDEKALLLDVRTPGEFLSASLPGSRNFPIEQLPQRLDEVERLLQGNKDQPIVVYCASGGRAARAKQILMNAGFRNVTNLGGISNWPVGR